MRKRIGGWLLALSTLAVWLAPGAAFGQYQNQEVVPMTGYLPGPLGHPRMEDGGFYLALEGLYMRQSNPIGNQNVAFRGFIDVGGGITGTPGTFVGSGDVALSTNQVNGPVSFQPGFNLVGGWRFGDGTVLQVSWLHLWQARYAAVASILPPGYAVGPTLADTFLTAPVVNFPGEFAGTPQNVTGGQVGDTFGIWNAASLMGLSFVQRFDMVDITGRIPIFQTDSHRTYALVGPRLVWFWERFAWRTVSADPGGGSSPADQSLYSNVISNRLYGLMCGGGHDWFLGDTPVGGFGINVDLGASLYYDFVKERAKYERGDRAIAYSRARNVYRLVPGLEAKVGFWWYPWEAVQVKVDYNWMVFFNTVASSQPIDFNFASLTPVYNSATRWLDGLGFGIGFVF
ncbi:MAG: hypothetical protein FJ271_30785 [Planctomycetes bacterium]|nr:hypothetical protein [Planctomycetota bacterium]